MKIWTTLGLALGLAFAAAACGDDDNTTKADGSIITEHDASVIVDGSVTVDAAVPDCVMNPTTHLEIINACTTSDVTKIKKTPVTPLLPASGVLPALP